MLVYVRDVWVQLQRQIYFIWPQEHALSHWDTLPFWHPQPSPQDPTLGRICGRRQSTSRVLSGLKEFLSWDTGLSNLCFFVSSPFGFISAHSEKIQPRDPCATFSKLKMQERSSKHPDTITGTALELHWCWYKEAGACSQEQDQGRRRGEKRTTVAPSSLPYVAVKTPPEAAGI